jgi:NADH-quinone oxidoreductase subunit M
MFRIDSFALVALATYAVLTLITLATRPRVEGRAEGWSRWGWIVAGTALAYVAGSPGVFLLGWALTVVPFWRDAPGAPRAPRLVLGLSTLSLALGFLTGSFAADAPSRWVGFSLIALAALLRKGIFPFHFWIPMAFERGSLAELNLLMNSHLGAYLMVRFAVPQFPDAGADALSLLGVLAIFTAVYAALLALVAARPRRILALLCTSQASFILAGIENRNVEGITGALLLWWVVAFATTSLLAIYAALEARTQEAVQPRGYLGLAAHAPRLAVLFAVSALALVGLPGTLGFTAEDLLFHGALASHPLLGAGLPLATALNAVTALRLLAVLFWGRRGTEVPRIADALPRERWALTLPVLLLVAGGLAPHAAVAIQGPSANWIAGLLAGR